MEYQLVLSSYVVEELKGVVKRKFPNKVGVVDTLLAKMTEILTPAKFVEKYG